MESYNGMAVILGELRAESRHTVAAVDRLTGAVFDQNQILIELPDKIAEQISLKTIATQASATRPSEAQGILKAIPPILKAAVPLLTIIGLMSGRISWSDLPSLLGIGGP